MNTNLEDFETQVNRNRFTGWYLKQSRFKRLILSYLLDWIVTLVLLLLFCLLYLQTPFQRPFSIEDKTISFPFKQQETIPEWLLAVLGGAIPLLFILIISLGIRKSPHDLHHGALGLFLGLSLTLVIIISFKFTIGRHRPDFLARCVPKLPTGLDSDPKFGLFDTSICTQTNKDILDEGQRSFTSGHAAVSFCGLGYLSLFLAGKLHIFDKKGHTYKTFIVILPLIGALFISITRVQDFLHHWSDVFVGGIIGIMLAFFSYRQYYPSICSRFCHIPYSPRIKKNESNILEHDNSNDPKLEMTIDKINNNNNDNQVSSQGSSNGLSDLSQSEFRLNIPQP